MNAEPGAGSPGQIKVGDDQAAARITRSPRGSHNSPEKRRWGTVGLPEPPTPRQPCTSFQITW
jgi:hypothetical protein